MKIPGVMTKGGALEFEHRYSNCSYCDAQIERKARYSGPWELLPFGQVAYRHALPPPLGAGNDCWNSRSWSTAGATEEAGGRVGWGL